MDNPTDRTTDLSISINLSDLYLFFSYDHNNYTAWLNRTESNRFYIGSYFCEKYFLKSTGRARNEIFLYATERANHLTIVVPLCSNQWITPVKQMLTDLILQYPTVDEVVVNDYAMLSFINEMRSAYNLSLKIIAGRLFFKNYRDPRYREQQKSKTICFFPPVLHEKINAAELDLCSENMDVSSIPEEIELYYHYPFSYVTCTQYCEFASGIAPDIKKFRPGIRCGLKCMDALIHTDADNAELFHLGKGVYTPVPKFLNSSRPADRYIYWPLTDFLHMRGNPS